MEHIVRDFIMEHFLTNGFFSDKQYGFIKGRSTVLQLLKILDDWTSQLDAGKQVDVIYTDFEKAFDKVPHHALINKLLANGLDSTVEIRVGVLLLVAASTRGNRKTKFFQPHVAAPSARKRG